MYPGSGKVIKSRYAKILIPEMLSDGIEHERYELIDNIEDLHIRKGGIKDESPNAKQNRITAVRRALDILIAERKVKRIDKGVYISAEISESNREPEVEIGEINNESEIEKLKSKLSSIRKILDE